MFNGVAVLATLLLAAQAAAQTCTPTISDLDFGAVSALAGSTVDATATVTVSCNGGNSDSAVCVHLGIGNAGGFAGGTRQLQAGAQAIDFDLYADPSRSDVWRTVGGTGAAQGTYTLIVPRFGTASQTIYGRLTMGTATPGAYASTFTSGVDVRVLYQDSQNDPVADGCNQDHARERSAGFTVRASVAPYCDIASGALDFGTSGPITANLDATGTLTIGCTNGTTYAVSLGNGLNALGPQRRMASGGSYLDYDLYTDTARTQPWRGTTTANGTGTGTPVSIPVYGRIPPQGVLPPGTYTDTVVVTITY